MRRLILVVSQKGGVGKSTFARGLVDVARCRGLRTAAFDADGGVGQLLMHYGERGPSGALLETQDPVSGVGYFDVRDERAREQLLSLIDVPADLVVVDLPGGTIDALAAVVPGGLRGLVALYEEEGWEVRVAHVITPLKACALEALRIVELLGSTAGVVVVKNLGRGASEDFYLFDGDPEGRYGRGRRAVTAGGGSVIEMPALRARTYAFVDERSLRFSSLEENREPGHRGDRKWMRDWLVAFEAAVSPLVS